MEGWGGGGGTTFTPPPSPLPAAVPGMWLAALGLDCMARGGAEGASLHVEISPQLYESLQPTLNFTTNECFHSTLPD